MESRPSVFVDANVFLDVLWKNKGWESTSLTCMLTTLLSLEYMKKL